MNKLKIGLSPITNTIYVGTVSKKGLWLSNRTDVTMDALMVVIHHVLALEKPVEIRNVETNKFEFRITVEDLRKKESTSET